MTRGGCLRERGRRVTRCCGRFVLCSFSLRARSTLPAHSRNSRTHNRIASFPDRRTRNARTRSTHCCRALAHCLQRARVGGPQRQLCARRARDADFETSHQPWGRQHVHVVARECIAGALAAVGAGKCGAPLAARRLDRRPYGARGGAVHEIRGAHGSGDGGDGAGGRAGRVHCRERCVLCGRVRPRRSRSSDLPPRHTPHKRTTQA